MLVLKKVRQRLGLTRLKMAVTGAAPIHRDVLEYFMGVNIPVMEVFGMSENTGPATLNVLGQWKVGTCGPKIAGVYMKIDDPDDSGEGEVREREREILCVNIHTQSTWVCTCFV